MIDPFGHFETFLWALVRYWFIHLQLSDRIINIKKLKVINIVSIHVPGILVGKVLHLFLDAK